MIRRREPEPIVLPEKKVRKQVVLAPTVIALPLPRAQFRCAGCGSVAKAGDRFCGHCGVLLSSRRSSVQFSEG